MSSLKELKKVLRSLRKLKKDTPKVSESRRSINRQIREIKKQILAVDNTLKPTESKGKLIEEIERLYQLKGRPFLVDLRAYTEDELLVHLNKIK
jgi:hypothetical protein